MNEQLNLFDTNERLTPCVCTVSEAKDAKCASTSVGNVTYLPGCQPPAHHPRKGVKQEVYALKERDDVVRVAQWLRDHKDPKYLLAFTLGINLGLRANELLKLRTQDVFAPDGTVVLDRPVTVWQSKNKKHRELWLNEACKRALEAHYPHRTPATYHAGWLLPSREGGHITYRTLQGVLKEAAEACGVKRNFGTHSLRKTFGYNQYHQNHDIASLQGIFGHSSSAITLRYIGVTEDDVRAAYQSVSIDVYGEDS